MLLRRLRDAMKVTLPTKLDRNQEVLVEVVVVNVVIHEPPLVLVPLLETFLSQETIHQNPLLMEIRIATSLVIEIEYLNQIRKFLN